MASELESYVRASFEIDALSEPDVAVDKDDRRTVGHFVKKMAEVFCGVAAEGGDWLLSSLLSGLKSASLENSVMKAHSRRADDFRRITYVHKT